jgi:hypothetical protein
MVPVMVLSMVAAAAGDAATGPEQFHLSYGKQPGSMWVTWVRPGLRIAAAGEPFCSYSAEGSAAQRTAADARTYTDNQTGCRSDKAYGGPCVPWNGVIHTALMQSLPARTVVQYSCGTAGQLSAPRNFTTPPRAIDKGPVAFALMGDVGTSMRNVNGGMEQYNHTYPGAIFVRDQILANAKGTPPLRFVHTFGDISYANGNQPVWDGYGRDMEPLFSTIPGLFSPGNHDGEFEFGNSYNRAGEGGGDSGVSYALRFPGPGAPISFDSAHVGRFNSTSMYWSIDSGPVHLVATAGVLGFEPGTEQHRWLEADLAAAATPQRRAVVPWIILTDHYPLYCSLQSCNTPMAAPSTPQATAPAGRSVSPSAVGLQAAINQPPPCAKAACEDCLSCHPPYSNRSYCPSDPTPNQCALWTHRYTPCPPCRPKPPPVRWLMLTVGHRHVLAAAGSVTVAAAVAAITVLPLPP